MDSQMAINRYTSAQASGLGPVEAADQCHLWPKTTSNQPETNQLQVPVRGSMPPAGRLVEAQQRSPQNSRC